MENRKSRKSTFLYVILLTLCVPLAYVYLILVTGLLDKIQEGHIGLTLMIVFLPLFFYWGLVAVVGIINIGQSFKIYKTGNPIECVNRMLIHKYGLVVFFCVSFGKCVLANVAGDSCGRYGNNGKDYSVCT